MDTHVRSDVNASADVSVSVNVNVGLDAGAYAIVDDDVVVVAVRMNRRYQLNSKRRGVLDAAVAVAVADAVGIETEIVGYVEPSTSAHDASLVSVVGTTREAQELDPPSPPSYRFPGSSFAIRKTV